RRGSLVEDVSALILAGGLGTRLQGALDGIPKVLAPIGGRPFLCYLLDQLRAARVREAVLCTGYRASQIVEKFGHRYRDLALGYSHEPVPLGTGGAIRLALERVDARRILILNWDSYVNTPLELFHRWHRARESAVPGSLLLAWSDETSRFGSVVLGQRETISAFQEKSKLTGAGWISAGVYLLGRSLVESGPPGSSCSLELEMFPRWVTLGLGGYASNARFLDIGTPESLARAGIVMSAIAAAGNCPIDSIRSENWEQSDVVLEKS